MRNGKIKSFFAAFSLTCILIGAFCGFAAVDLSTDRYMPGQFGPFFEISKIQSGSFDFTFLAERYILETRPPEETAALIKKYRGLIPVLPQIFSSLAAEFASGTIVLLPSPAEE